MERFYAILWGLVGFGSVAAICVAGTVSCQSVNDRYYQGMQACLNQGGSWVPQSQSSYASSCINPHSRGEK